MNAREYLKQAYRLDQRINAKLEQVESLNALATKCTATITGMPHGGGQASGMADTVGKIVDLQTEINGDVDRLVDLKREIGRAIGAVQNVEHQTLLEKRYLCFLSWEQIAVDMNYSLRWTHIVHSRALVEADGTLQQRRVNANGLS